MFPTKPVWDEFLRSGEPPDRLGGRRAVMVLTRDDVERWGPLPLEFVLP